MNRVIFNIWMAVGILILSYIAWEALDSFNNKNLLKIAIFILVGGFIASILHFRTILRDHKDIYDKVEEVNKNVKKIAGDLPH